MDFYFCEAEKYVKILLHAVGLDKYGLLLFILRGDTFLKSAPGKGVTSLASAVGRTKKIRANPFNLVIRVLYRNKKKGVHSSVFNPGNGGKICMTPDGVDYWLRKIFLQQNTSNCIQP